MWNQKKVTTGRNPWWCSGDSNSSLSPESQLKSHLLWEASLDWTQDLCPCSQNTVLPWHRLHCPTSSQSHWTACPPYYMHDPVSYGGCLTPMVSPSPAIHRGSGKTYPRSKKYTSLGQDSLPAEQGLHESASLQFFLFQAACWGQPSVCSPNQI